MSSQFICQNISISNYSVYSNNSNSNNSVLYKCSFCSYTVKCQNSSFLTVQFCISTQFSSIWLVDRTLSSATILGQSGPCRDGNKGVLRIPKSSIITGTSPSDCLVSYPGHSLVGGGLTSLQRSSVFNNPSLLGKFKNMIKIYIEWLQEVIVALKNRKNISEKIIFYIILTNQYCLVKNLLSVF